MGFGSIMDLFRSDNWSAELVERINKMLALGADMFAYTTNVVIDGAPDDDPQKQVYNRDKKINKLERKIRRRVISRLVATDSGADVPSALIFMNVVKDGERIGDYVKNIHEINALIPTGDRSLYKKRLGDTTRTVADLFAKARQAFAESDEALAGQVIKRARAEGRAYEEAIREITTSDLPTQDAVCLVLILRFYKRLVAHMSNIATTVVMPLDMIDFYDEDEEPKAN
jgi:phosphate uptake regulator